MRAATSCFRSALCDSVFELGTGVWESMSVLYNVGVGSMRSGIVWEEPRRVLQRSARRQVGGIFIA